VTSYITRCRRAGGRHDMPRPGLQGKRAAAALSQAGRAGPDQPIRAIQPVGRPHTPPADRMYATHVRQHHRLMPPGRGHNNQPQEGDNFRGSIVHPRPRGLVLIMGYFPGNTRGYRMQEEEIRLISDPLPRPGIPSPSTEEYKCSTPRPDSQLQV